MQRSSTPSSSLSSTGRLLVTTDVVKPLVTGRQSVQEAAFGAACVRRRRRTVTRVACFTMVSMQRTKGCHTTTSPETGADSIRHHQLIPVSKASHSIHAFVEIGFNYSYFLISVSFWSVYTYRFSHPILPGVWVRVFCFLPVCCVCSFLCASVVSSDPNQTTLLSFSLC